MRVGDTAKQIKLMSKYIFLLQNCLQNFAVFKIERQKQFHTEKELENIYFMKVD